MKEKPVTAATCANPDMHAQHMDLFSVAADCARIAGEQVMPRPAQQARITDPETSQDAADEMKRSGKLSDQRQEVLRSVPHPEMPWKTAGEIWQTSGTAGRYTVSRRLPELERLGHVERKRDESGRLAKRRCTVMGSKQTLWRRAK